MEKIFAIGDIHGCLDKLQALMEKVDIDADRDTLVFTGDYIDRGPNSFEVVEYLINLQNRFRKIIFLKGNHEDLFEKYLSGTLPNNIVYFQDGGRQTMESYLKKNLKNSTCPIPHKHLDFFKSLLYSYQTDDYIFVHAGLRDHVPFDLQDPDDLLWMRGSFIKSDYDFGKRVIFGHTPFRKPLVLPNKIGIDTGAVYGNKLTCIELPKLVFYGA